MQAHCIAYNLCLNFLELGIMAEGGDASAQNIYLPSKRTKSEVWAYFEYYKNAEGQLIEDS